MSHQFSVFPNVENTNIRVYRVLKHEAKSSEFTPDKTRAASCLNGFKNKKPVPWESEQRLKNTKNKPGLITILYIKNSNEECFIGLKLMLVTIYRCFDKLLGA